MDRGHRPASDVVGEVLAVSSRQGPVEGGGSHVGSWSLFTVASLMQAKGKFAVSTSSRGIFFPGDTFFAWTRLFRGRGTRRTPLFREANFFVH